MLILVLKSSNLINCLQIRCLIYLTSCNCGHILTDNYQRIKNEQSRSKNTDIVIKPVSRGGLCNILNLYKKFAKEAISRII